MTSMNDLIRAAAGRPTHAAPEPEPTPPGDLGGGRGGSAMPTRHTPSADFGERIRKASRVARATTLRDGINIDLDDPWR
jgi:hypothetical protein